MKTQVLLITLAILFVFSTSSYGKWTKMSESVDGVVYYVDFNRIRKQGGHVYFWQLYNYLKPTKYGDLSAKKYSQGDCKKFRYKDLSWSFHKAPMGRGRSDGQEPVKKGWRYPPLNSLIENLLNTVCKYAK